MHVREARPADIELVHAMRMAFLAAHRGVEPTTFDEGFVEETRTFLARQQDAGRLHSWLAEDDGCVGVTSMLLVDVPPRPEERRTLEGYVLNVYVVPEARRRGVGLALIDATVAAAPSLGVRRLYLHTTDHGRPLYAQVGFTSNTDWLERRVPPAP